MGAWGTGISSSDEYKDIYDEIMDDYNKGIPINVVIDGILRKYEKDYEDDINYLHNLYFAAAYSCWECGYLNEYVYEKVKDVITQGEDIKCWKELEASPSDLKKREKALNLFLSKISISKEKPKKPKPTKFKPAIFEKGDVLSVQLEDGTFTGAIVLENFKVSEEFGENFIVKAYMQEDDKPSLFSILKAKVYDYCWYLGVQYKKYATRIEVIGKIDIKYNYPCGGIGTSHSGWITFVSANNSRYYALKENSGIKNVKSFLDFKPTKIAEMQKQHVINSL